MNLSKLYECIKRKKVNNSYAREAIYKVLLKANNCMSVSEIITKLQTTYTKKVSLNTVYRHLSLFVECELALVIQDDFKKAYYSLTSEKAKVFSLCTKCNKLEMIQDTTGIDSVLLKLDKSSFITMYKKCLNCK